MRHITTPFGVWISPVRYEYEGVEDGDLESIAHQVMFLHKAQPSHFTTIAFDNVLDKDTMFKLVADGRSRLMKRESDRWLFPNETPIHFCVIEGSESGNKPHIHFCTWNAKVLPSHLDSLYESKKINCTIETTLITDENSMDKLSYLFKTYSNPRWEKRQKVIGIKETQLWRYFGHEEFEYALS
jgi:hypothetical protein